MNTIDTKVETSNDLTAIVDRLFTTAQNSKNAILDFNNFMFGDTPVAEEKREKSTDSSWVINITSILYKIEEELNITAEIINKLNEWK